MATTVDSRTNDDEVLKVPADVQTEKADKVDRASDTTESGDEKEMDGGDHLTETEDGDSLDSGDEKVIDEEREVWEFMTPMAWHKSIADADSIFNETYQATRQLVQEMAKRGGYDVIIEVGCGTGDVIGELETDVPRFGLDINSDFIKHCVDHYYPNQEKCEFHVADALQLIAWWKDRGLDAKFKKPLVTCVNNTLNIMPEHLRAGVVAQMMALAGTDGLCMASYWNGQFFSHAVMSYYRKNEALCGKFELHNADHVDWEHRTLVTPTNYSTEWHTPKEVQRIMRGMDVDVANRTKTPQWGEPHLFMAGLAIFVWFDHTSKCTNRSVSDLLAIGSDSDAPSSPGSAEAMVSKLITTLVADETIYGLSVDMTAVREWLRDECGMEQYVSMFESNGVDQMDAVRLLSVEDLTMMGISKVGHRLLIERQIDVLKQQE